ncbi:unnamed protein product [Moneuplotes crassus]|uniref:Palmitoyltransferase n=1 Tax=Euplotes crassus TaxID=5936 RepID=A0AAD1UQ09_EUPCR|nr:unnamed protein product [Moneuplotes crassus]
MNIPSYRSQERQLRRVMAKPRLFNYPGAKRYDNRCRGFLSCLFSIQGLIQMLKVLFLPLFYCQCGYLVIYKLITNENLDNNYFFDIACVVMMALSSASFVQALLTDPGYLDPKRDLEHQRSNLGTPKNISIELSGNCEWKSKSNSKRSKVEIELLSNEEMKDVTGFNVTDRNLETMIKYSCDERNMPEGQEEEKLESSSPNASDHQSNSVEKSFSGKTGNSLGNLGSPFDESVHPKLSKIDYCVKCSCNRSPRTHHCSICKICVIRMDHHCSWISNCVGVYNHKFYLLFLIYTCLLGISVTFKIALDCRRDILALFSINEGFINIMRLLALVVSILISLITGNLCIYQIQMALLNRTTLEDMTGNYDKLSTLKLTNMKFIMGETLLTWWIPINPRFAKQLNF